MQKTLIRRLAIGLFIVYLLAVTWPGTVLFASAEPRVFGLPFSLAWPIVWILIGWAMLLVLDHVEHKDDGE